jgi:hypothetical protein
MQDAGWLRHTRSAAEGPERDRQCKSTDGTSLSEAPSAVESVYRDASLTRPPTGSSTAAGVVPTNTAAAVNQNDEGELRS